MKIGKLLSGFKNANLNDKLNNFIQDARINEEMQKMNEEITFIKFKNILKNIFKENKSYQVFNIEKELAKKYLLIIPDNNNLDEWNKNAFTYFYPEKNILFCAIPANKKEKTLFNVHFFIIQQNKLVYRERITFANQMEDVKSKIDFYIGTAEFLDDYEYPKFEDLKLNYLWFQDYKNLKYLTTNCFKSGICKKKKCLNDKCESYYPFIDYITNMYKCNLLFNTAIEGICKKYNKQVKISVKNKSRIYSISNMDIVLSLPTRKDKDISSASFKLLIDNKVISQYYKVKCKNGKELYELFMCFLSYLYDDEAVITENLK